MRSARSLAAGLLALAATAAADLLPSASDFDVHSISVNHELGGAIHSTSQLHLVQQPLQSSNGKYYLALSAAEAASLSWSEVNLKLGPGMLPEQRATVDLVHEGSVPTTTNSAGSPLDVTHLYSVQLPNNFLTQVGADSNVVTPNITVNVDFLFHRISEALPKAVVQKEVASLLWQGDALPRSVYGAKRVRVKARAPTAKILSHAASKAFDEEKVTKSGSVVTFGPVDDVKPFASVGDIPQARVHYVYDQPVVGMVDLNRHVEVSHWGDNLAIEDKIWLRNDGPALKGHFSRVDHQVAVFHGGAGRNLLTDFAFLLPSGARDAYFVDTIGNVSTSHFRGSPADPSVASTASHKLADSVASYLHLQPRYPLMGGWNYTFTVGWNLGLGEGGWGRRLPASSSTTSGNEYSAAVPFWNPIKDVPAGKVTTRIVLPEGATLLSVEAPFAVDSMETEVYTTYLDTVGRPAVVLTKTLVSDADAGNVYLRYRLDAGSHVLKPVSVASVALALFSAAVLVRRLQTAK